MGDIITLVVSQEQEGHVNSSHAAFDGWKVDHKQYDSMTPALLLCRCSCVLSQPS